MQNLFIDNYIEDVSVKNACTDYTLGCTGCDGECLYTCVQQCSDNCYTTNGSGICSSCDNSCDGTCVGSCYLACTAGLYFDVK